MSTPQLDPECYDVLNTIALKKMATAQAVADATGMSMDRVTGALAELQLMGLAATIGEQTLPMDEAVSALVATAEERYASVRKDSAVMEMAGKFEIVNGQFLTAISAWQQIDIGGRKITNDHSDAEYDYKILDRIEKLVGRLIQLIRVLSDHDSRFDRYAVRFTRANDRVAGGDLAYVSSPTIESVHNIWFEFHEDLLRTMGRERSE